VTNLLKKLKLSELSLVDAGANQHAAVTIFKRDNAASEIVKGLYSEGADLRAIDFRDVLSRNQKRKDAREVREEIWPMLDALSESLNSIVVDANVNDKMPAVERQVQAFLDAVREKMPEVEEDLMKIFKDVAAESLGTTKTNVSKEDDKKVSEETKVTVEDLQKRLDETTTNLKKAEALAKMSDDEKAYMAKMSDDDKAAFALMSAEDRKKKMDAAKKSDETIEVDGETISKSAVGAETFALYKRFAAVEKTAKENAERAELAVFEKRAAVELKHLAGDDSLKARVLKSLSEIADTDARSMIEGVLKSKDQANEKLFETIGKSGGNGEENRLDTAAKAIAKSQSITYEQAVVKALEANPELYNEGK